MLKKSIHLTHPRYWLAWLGLGILWLITRLPFQCQIWLGSALGNILYCFPTKLKKITRANIRLCFPQLTLKEQTTFIKKNFASLGIGLVETGIAWWLPDHKLKQSYTLHGLEHAEAAFAKGKGIILLGPHCTTIEILGRLVGMHYSFAAMYQPHKKPFIAFIHERFRKKKSIHFIPNHHLREFLRTLEKNHAIWYAYDVDGGRKRSVFAPFFGIQTASLTALSRMAQISKAAVIPISYYRQDNRFHYDIFLHPALENFPSENLEQDAARLNAFLEKSIRHKPEQYIWQYKRFKTRPLGEKRFYES